MIWREDSEYDTGHVKHKMLAAHCSRYGKTIISGLSSKERLRLENCISDSYILG